MAPRPYTLVAELTYRCPLSSVYCSNPVDFHAQRDELTAEQWRRTFEAAADLGVVQLHLTGGEPQVRKDLPELVGHGTACELFTNMITGGTLLDEVTLTELRDCGPALVQLSLQDTERGPAERVAGARSYDKKIEIPQLIKRLGIARTTNVVLHNLNIARVDEIIAQVLKNRSVLLPPRDAYDGAKPSRSKLVTSTGIRWKSSS